MISGIKTRGQRIIHISGFNEIITQEGESNKFPNGNPRWLRLEFSAEANKRVEAYQTVTRSLLYFTAEDPANYAYDIKGVCSLIITGSGWP